MGCNSHSNFRSASWSRTALVVAGLVAAAGLGGCSASQHASNVRKGLDGETLTVGTVQKSIRVGMSGADVATALGSPNVVSTDENGQEVWIYDRIATDVVYSEGSGGGGILGGGGGGSVVGGIGGVFSGSAGAASKSQRSLTVVIKFDENSLVRDVAYHSSRF